MAQTNEQKKLWQREHRAKLMADPEERERHRRYHREYKQRARASVKNPTPANPDRPKTRAECEAGPRPCPWYSCQYHLGTDVGADGSLHVRFEPDDIADRDTCALDVADQGALTCEQVGEKCGITRAAVNLVELSGLRKMRARLGDGSELEEILEEACTRGA